MVVNEDYPYDSSVDPLSLRFGNVADTKFDSDDESSLLIKCRRAHIVHS